MSGYLPYAYSEPSTPSQAVHRYLIIEGPISIESNFWMTSLLRMKDSRRVCIHNSNRVQIVRSLSMIVALALSLAYRLLLSGSSRFGLSTGRATWRFGLPWQKLRAIVTANSPTVILRVK